MLPAAVLWNIPLQLAGQPRKERMPSTRDSEKEKEGEKLGNRHMKRAR